MRDTAGLPDVQALRRRPPREHEACVIFHDPHFGRPSIKVLPGEYFVHDSDIVVTTTLGSCVAACLHDAGAGIGGMNHFMLPEIGPDGDGDSARYGAFAMELLIAAMLRQGARREAIQAKIFGGAQLMRGGSGVSVGEANVAFVRAFLQREGVPVVGADVLDVCPRRICQFPRSGRVLCRRMPVTQAAGFALQESRYRQSLSARPVPAPLEWLP